MTETRSGLETSRRKSTILTICLPIAVRTRMAASLNRNSSGQPPLPERLDKKGKFCDIVAGSLAQISRFVLGRAEQTPESLCHRRIKEARQVRRRGNVVRTTSEPSIFD
jgi:hypothetical protein